MLKTKINFGITSKASFFFEALSTVFFVIMMSLLGGYTIYVTILISKLSYLSIQLNGIGVLNCLYLMAPIYPFIAVYLTHKCCRLADES